MQKAQSAIEFLTTYSWAFLIIGIFVVLILTSALAPGTNASTNIPESCYISPSLPCSQALMLTNSISTSFFVLFQNNLGVTLLFPPNAITVVPSYYSNSSFLGQCLPSNGLIGSVITCNATIPGYTPSVGSQLNPRFTLTYQICSPKCTKQAYNTTGVASTVATLYKNLIFNVQLLDIPANGNIVLNSVSYANSVNVIFISGATYSIYAAPPNSFLTFNSWIASSNVIVAAATQSTTANAIGPGTLEATFH